MIGAGGVRHEGVQCVVPLVQEHRGTTRITLSQRMGEPQRMANFVQQHLVTLLTHLQQGRGLQIQPHIPGFVTCCVLRVERIPFGERLLVGTKPQLTIIFIGVAHLHKIQTHHFGDLGQNTSDRILIIA